MSNRTETPRRSRAISSVLALGLVVGAAFLTPLSGVARADTAASPDTTTRIVVDPPVSSATCNPTGSPIPQASTPCATNTNGVAAGDTAVISGLTGHDFVSIHIDGSSGTMNGTVQTRLCRASITAVSLSSELSPTNGDCIPANAAGFRGSDSGNGNHLASGGSPSNTYVDYTFKIGEGIYDPPGAPPPIRCGFNNPCTLWIQESVSNAVDASGSIFKHYQVQYAKSTIGDFESDGVTDLSVYRPDAGAWIVNDSSTASLDQAYVGAANSDVAVPGDYDGVGGAEMAVYRPSTGAWLVRNPSSGVVSQFYLGNGTDDIPVPADYDGDGRTDFAVYRPSAGLWVIRKSSNASVVSQYFGATGSGDTPVPGDFDGDGKADFAIYRQAAGLWFVLRSSDAVITQTPWGNKTTDVPVVGDFDGDGKADLAVYRPDTGGWFIRNSSGGTAQAYYGNGTTDVPQPGDFDKDGKTDLAVYRPNTGGWFLLPSTGVGSQQAYWGNGTTDVGTLLPYAVRLAFF